MALMIGMCAPACDETVVHRLPASYLVVAPTREQPEGAAGTILVVDAKGGDEIRVRTKGALHEYSVSAEPLSRSCVVNATFPLFLYISPTDEETLVFVDLLLKNGTADGTAPQVIESDCSGVLVEERVLRLRLGQLVVEDEDAGAAR